MYVLLALGLNVVVGWAGLLDLGYIAFYEVGAYTTAYFVGSLPMKPPSWLHLTPLATIPFAILACLIAGILLGAPTLRLRGDYLAIVTLGFGEIIQLWAINARGITGGPQGPTIPHPSIHLLGIHITWGQDNLPYWYLLLVMLVVVMILFYRLEGSRIGRAWAAIREDEVAAQASGVNTLRVKLLAFAIGASTSALAGVVLRQPGRLLRPDPVHAAGLDPHRRLRGLRRHGFARRRDGRRGRAHLAAAVPQGAGAAERPADVGRRARPGR